MIVLFLLLSFSAWSFDCHYDYTVWNTRTRSSEGPISVQKWKKDLSQEEKGPFDCTPCKEDQAIVKLSNGLTFEACNKVADKFRAVLESAIKQNVPLITVLAYRPSKSKGPADEHGFRTQLSNHAFGVSLDVNENFNGLYNNCIQWGPQCVLGKGGPYRPHQDPRSLTDDSMIVMEMLKAGFKWGGKIEGVQKDFMHFSPDGY